VQKPLPPPSTLYARPLAVLLKDVEWSVIGKVDGVLDRSKLAEFEAEHDAAFCVPAKGYENLSTNLADIIRNVKGLQELVIRYETDRLEAWNLFKEVHDGGSN